MRRPLVELGNAGLIALGVLSAGMGLKRGAPLMLVFHMRVRHEGTKTRNKAFGSCFVARAVVTPSGSIESV